MRREINLEGVTVNKCMKILTKRIGRCALQCKDAVRMRVCLFKTILADKNIRAALNAKM